LAWGYGTLDLDDKRLRGVYRVLPEENAVLRPALVCIAMTATLAATTSAWTQTGAMPPDIATKLLELGRVVDPEKTAPLYAPLQPKEPYAGVKATRDVK
jgi:hypothetical protein